MLTDRQRKILNYLSTAEHNRMPIEKMKDVFNVGEKSLSNDIKSMNKDKFGGYIFKENNDFVLQINDNEKIHAYLSKVNDALQYGNYSDPLIRSLLIISKLLKTITHLKSSDIQKELYISKSTLTNDLAKVRDILKAYDLELEIKPHYGLKIIGDEIKIRNLIVQRLANLYLPTTEGYIHAVHTEEIRTILTDTLLEYQFRVSDIVFQNLIIHIATSINRLKNGNKLSSTKQLPLAFFHAQSIAEEIYRRCALVFNIPCDEGEIKFLATEIQCKREYDEHNSISEEINNFVFGALKEIKRKFNIDFLANMDLRISLALHTNPLITRLKNNMQLNNALALEVKQSYPYAYDLANEYAYSVFREYNIKPNEDEIAYLALHFIAAIKNDERANANQKVLLISEQRKSNTILIQQQILNWFKNDIFTVTTINIIEIDSTNLDEYDAILTTTEEVLQIIPSAVMISFFPSEKDRVKIEMAFSGITRASEVMKSFHKELFYYGEVTDKNELINILCDKAIEYYSLDESFRESVMFHESIANTFFGNKLSMPHPDTYITEESFICVGIPSTPIQWDEEPEVQLVLLVSIRKNDPKALRLWQYLSFLINDDTLLKQILHIPIYDNFYNVLSKFYKKIFDK